MTEFDSDFATPMMQQYQQLKAEYNDCILFFRLGDFYEMFLDDAKLGAKILNITLTSRARGKDGRIPMAGVPYHAVDNYLSKLVKHGHKVAICEQVGDVSSGKLVEREVIRIVTPGTLLSDTAASATSNNYVLCLYLDTKEVGVAVADISTGFLAAGSFTFDSEPESASVINTLLARLNPSECLVSPQAEQDFPKIIKSLDQSNVHLSVEQDWTELKKASKSFLRSHFGKEEFSTIDAQHSVSARRSASILLKYFYQTQRSQISHITKLEQLFQEDHLKLDKATITNLELLEPLVKDHQNTSLLHYLDNTQTSAGSRLLRNWLLKPLIQKKLIEQRLETVGYFVNKESLLNQIRDQLKDLYDIERILSKAAINLVTPRDLKNLELSLATNEKITDLVAQHKVTGKLFKKIVKNLNSKKIPALMKQLAETLVDEPPVDPKTGGLVKAGISPKIDKLNQTISKNREWMINFEQSEKDKTGITSLKVRFNKVFGFYIEVSKSFTDQVPDSYIRRQTLVNAERYITPEMKKREDLILESEEKVKDLELEVFNDLIASVLKQVKDLQQIAHSLAQLDCLTNLAKLAINNNLTKPTITTTGKLNIEDGRHPVVEQFIYPNKFVPNTTQLSNTKNQVMIITGPNMAGKSVLMRQVALITLMAHLGSYVPATQATISIVDSIFVRSGAHDNVASGLSTFMVEMVETANILNNATDRSLVIMDEIGRGTSTYDGISIAWAVAEELVAKDKPNPKTLFATHYHELQELAESHPDRISNYHMAIDGNSGKPAFLYTLQAGKSSHSYGVAVAELAGIPDEVVKSAQKLLQNLENNHQSVAVQNSKTIPREKKDQFSSPSTKSSFAINSNMGSKLLNQLKDIEIATTTPLEALQLLHQWQTQLKANQNNNQSNHGN